MGTTAPEATSQSGRWWRSATGLATPSATSLADGSPLSEPAAVGHSSPQEESPLVSLGAALFTVAGAYGFGDIERTANVDPARIAAQVATGVGFIGAGAIIRNGTSVQGVTTAATVRSVPAAARWSGAPRRHGRSRWTCVARPRARGPAHRPLARLPRRGVSAGGGAPM